MSNPAVAQPIRSQPVITAEPGAQLANQSTSINKSSSQSSDSFPSRPIAPQVQRPVLANRPAILPPMNSTTNGTQPVATAAPVAHILAYQPINQPINQTLQPGQAVLPMGSASPSAPSAQAPQSIGQTNNQNMSAEQQQQQQQQQQLQYQQAMSHQALNQSILSSPTARYAYIATPASPGVGSQFTSSPPSAGSQPMNQPVNQSANSFALAPTFAGPQLFTSVSPADINSLYQSTSGGFMVQNAYMKNQMMGGMHPRPPSRDSMNVRKNACAVCHQAKTSCNGQRPCDRCIRLDRQQLCVDRPRKQPRRAEKPVKKCEDEFHSPASTKAKRVKVEHEQSAEVRRVPEVAPPAQTRPVAPKSDSSGASGESKEPSPTEDSHESDFATNSAQADDAAHRQCSASYARCHSHQQTRAQILEALAKGDLSPAQASFYVHYFAAILTEEDFAALMAVPQAASVEGNVDAARAWLSDVMPGRNLPKFTFSFADSLADAVEDESSLGADFATMQITCRLDTSGPDMPPLAPATPVPASPQSSLISSSSSAFSSWAAQQAAAAAAVAAEHQKHLESLVVTSAHLTVRVNREFERLFGWSQRQIRDMFAREAGLMLYRMIAPSSHLLLTKLLSDGMLGAQSEWKRVIKLMTQFGSTLDAMFIGRWLLDENGVFKACSYSFAGLPDEIQPSR